MTWTNVQLTKKVLPKSPKGNSCCIQHLRRILLLTQSETCRRSVLTQQFRSFVMHFSFLVGNILCSRKISVRVAANLCRWCKNRCWANSPPHNTFETVVSLSHFNKNENLSHAFYYFSSFCSRFAFSCRDYLMKHSLRMKNIYSSDSRTTALMTCEMGSTNFTVMFCVVPKELDSFTLNSIVLMFRRNILHIE